jgi:hypothetical protein
VVKNTQQGNVCEHPGGEKVETGNKNSNPSLRPWDAKMKLDRIEPRNTKMIQKEY